MLSGFELYPRWVPLCIYIGLVFIKDRPVSSFWVLRFRVLGASVFVFECFVFETTNNFAHVREYNDMPVSIKVEEVRSRLFKQGETLKMQSFVLFFQWDLVCRPRLRDENAVFFSGMTEMTHVSLVMM